MAFLNAIRQEDVFIMSLLGCLALPSGLIVLKLNKALYGLKQSPREWNLHWISISVKICGWLVSRRNSAFKCVYYSQYIMAGVYVDDLIITGSTHATKEMIAQKIHKLIQYKNLGALYRFLNMDHSHSWWWVILVSLCERFVKAF